MTFAEMRKELARDDVERYAIYARTGTGRYIALFTWRGLPKFGIEKAKKEAIDFGMTDLHDFFARKL